MHALCASVLVAADARKPDSVTLALAAPVGVTTTRCDEMRLKQVLVNLVENAIKYSPGGGRVEVRVVDEDDRLRIEVSDEGLGIPRSEHVRIFEKFYRLDVEMTRGVGGSGLGLYISREIVQQMGGSLSLESTAGAGSTFTVTLPRSSSVSRIARPPLRRPARVAGRLRGAPLDRHSKFAMLRPETAEFRRLGRFARRTEAEMGADELQARLTAVEDSVKVLQREVVSIQLALVTQGEPARARSTIEPSRVRPAPVVQPVQPGQLRQPFPPRSTAAAKPASAIPAPAPRPPKPRRELDLADLLGAKALAWAGGVVTLLGVLFFFVLAVNNGWIGAVARIALGGGASLVVGLVALWLRRRFGDTHASLAAVGVSIAGGYATLAAATVLYDLISEPVALAVAADRGGCGRGRGCLALGAGCGFRSRRRDQCAGVARSRVA